MRRAFLFLSLLGIVFTGALFIHAHQSIAIQRVGSCVNIPATPDYLATNSAHDAIAAIDNARHQEQLPALRLPANFYQMTPIQQQFVLLNLERVDRHLQPLVMDANLSHMAQGYSQQLLNLQFFAHTSPIGGSFETRMNSNPLVFGHYRLAAENLAGNPIAGVGPIYEYMYDDVVEACGHRENILDPDAHFVGIGVVPGSIYGSISVQEFLGSAPWNPYSATRLAPLPLHITLHTNNAKNQPVLYCKVQVAGGVGNRRITWFLDRVTSPLQVGSSWSLDLRRLSPGRHTVLAYVVDGEQEYAVARYEVGV